jgi:hypothetical protein
METLQEAIMRLEPRIDLLHDCLGFGRLAEVTETSDGFFLGRARGDIGFNHFLGRPSQAALGRTRRLFAQLNERQKEAVIRALGAHRIPLTSLGLSLVAL